MSEIAERYNRLAGEFAAKVAQVPEGAWDAATPCPDWTARDLVQHVVDSQGMFLGFIGLELGGIPSVAEDPAAAWDAARAKVSAALADPQTAKAEFDGFTGRSTFEDGVNRFLCFDLVVHGWDLARAAGLDESISSEDVARVRAAAEAFGDAIRSPGAFGPEVEPPAGAGDKDRLLAFLGRQP